MDGMRDIEQATIKFEVNGSSSDPLEAGSPTSDCATSVQNIDDNSPTSHSIVQLTIPHEVP